MIKSIVTLALLSSSAVALNCGPDMLTFQDNSVNALSGSSGSSSDKSSTSGNSNSNNGGIICVLVTNGSVPRFAFYGEGRVGQSQYRFLGHAFANSSNPTSSNLGQQQSSTQSTSSTTSASSSSQSQPSVSLTSPMVSIGGHQVEAQLSGSFAGTAFNATKQKLVDIYDQVTFLVSPDKIVVSNGKISRTWTLMTDLPNYQPLPLPEACGAHLDTFRVRYPEGVKVPTPAVGLRCAMPHKTGLLMTFMGVGRMSNTPYMYIATRGKGGQWGRVGICWHNPQLLAAGKCLKSDFGSFIVKVVDKKSGQLDINAEVQNGLRELWIPKALNAKKVNKEGGMTISGSGASYQVNQQGENLSGSVHTGNANISGSTYQGQGDATSQGSSNISGSTYQGGGSSSPDQGSSASSSSATPQSSSASDTTSQGSDSSQDSSGQSSDVSGSYEQENEYYEEDDYSQVQGSSSSSSSDVYQYDSSSQ